MPRAWNLGGPTAAVNVKASRAAMGAGELELGLYLVTASG